MGIDLGNFEANVQQAIRHFWSHRNLARMRQIERGIQDQGERSSVTSGKNMDGFINLATSIVRDNGLSNANIVFDGRINTTLPCYFRPTKSWDLLVINEGRLVAVIEFKSQVGPSFGNNFNNRVEEAIGSALDIAEAYRNGVFGDIVRPFLGFFFLLEDCAASRKPVRNPEPNYPVFPEFHNACYAERYNILCQKLVQENLYTAASIILSPREATETGEYTEMGNMTGIRTFFASLAGHIAAEAGR